MEGAGGWEGNKREGYVYEELIWLLKQQNQHNIEKQLHFNNKTLERSIEEILKLIIFSPKSQ